MSQQTSKVVRTVCQGCHSECGVLVHVEDGNITKIKPDPNHPSTRGFICVKGRNYAHFTYHPDRIKTPLKSTGEKGSGKWQKISWDQALDEIAEKFTAIRDRQGPYSLGTFHGTAPRGSLFACRLLASAMGTPNVGNTDLHICFAPSMVAELATVGAPVMQEEGPDYRFSRCILVCGGNPLVSHPPRGRDILEGVKNNGAKLIVIDPRKTQLAAKADTWFQIRPGTDVLLILAMLYTIIAEGLYDKAFVDQYCHGFDQLKSHVKDYPPEKVADLIWLKAEEIREAARCFAQSKPAVVHHRVAVEHNLNSTQTDRTLVILSAITGNIGVKGGNLLPTHIPGFIETGAVQGKYKLPASITKDRIGSSEYPLISGPDALFIFVHAALMAEAITDGKPYPLKGLYLAGGNPVVNMQNTRRTWDAFKRLECLVVTDFFMTPTAELADYVLPAATWLERDECCDEQYMNCIVARQKAIEPLHETRDDMQIVIDLVERLPWADRKYMPWDNAREFNDSRVCGLGMTFDEFKKKGYVVVETEYKQYEKYGFKTPTGKVEIWSTIFDKNGYDSLPSYVEPKESPYSRPDLIKDYPYILITGCRTIEYMHSMGRQKNSPHRNRRPNPEMEIHPDTAKKEKIADGDWVWIETPQIIGERVKFMARLTEKIHPNIIHAQHGWWFPEKPGPDHGLFESNIDVIISDDPPREAICGSIPSRGTLCKIYKLDKKNN